MDNTTTPHSATPSTTTGPTPFPAGDSGRSAPTTPADIASTAPADPKASTPVAEGLIQRVAQSAHEAIDSAAARASSMSEGLRGGVDKVGATRDEWLESARDAIRQHPFAAVTGALVIGAALLSLRSPGKR